MPVFMGLRTPRETSELFSETIRKQLFPAKRYIEFTVNLVDCPDAALWTERLQGARFRCVGTFLRLDGVEYEIVEIRVISWANNPKAARRIRAVELESEVWQIEFKAGLLD